MIPYNILDLSPIPAGGSATDALRNSLDLAQHAETLGYSRFWVAEHHNIPGIASSATAVLIGQIAAATSRIRVGSGGIMLPNHAPLVVAEAFGTLATLFPDRIDLGLGRAPGGDGITMQALRRTDDGSNFPRDVVEVMGFLGDPQPGQQVHAVPGVGTHVPVWILGSSLFGAQLAAQMGLPYAFASHFAPAALEDAAFVYRRDFQPSAMLEAPKFMLAVNVFAADSEEEAKFLRTSAQQAFLNLRMGRPGPLPRPRADFADGVNPRWLAGVNEALSIKAVGTVDQLRDQLAALVARHGPDEVILTGNIHDIAARKHSFALAAEAMRGL